MPDIRGPQLGLDVGHVRIGVAISDIEGKFATPLSAIDRSRSESAKNALSDDLTAVANLVKEHQVVVVVVGWPRTLQGQVARAAKSAERFVEQLRTRIDPVPVHLSDERVTTVMAHQQLREAGVRGKKLVRKGQRGVVDQLAAAAILQGWLDGQRYTIEEASRDNGS